MCYYISLFCLINYQQISSFVTLAALVEFFSKGCRVLELARFFRVAGRSLGSPVTLLARNALLNFKDARHFPESVPGFFTISLWLSRRRWSDAGSPWEFVPAAAFSFDGNGHDGFL